MKAEINILALGTDTRILQTILRLLHSKSGWTATGAATVQEALSSVAGNKYDVLLLGAGFSTAEEMQVSDAICAANPDVRVIPHYGGGSGLLFAEIYLAFGTMNQAQ